MTKRKTTTKYEPPITVRLGRDLMVRLRAEWKHSGVPIAEQIRRAVARWLDERESAR